MTAAQVPGVHRYGERGLLVDLAGPHSVHPFARAVERSGIAVDVIPGWSSVLVITAGDPAGLRDRLTDLARAVGDVEPVDDPRLHPARRSGDDVAAVEIGDVAAVEIGVVYDGPDLADVAHLVGLSQAEVVTLHTQPVYTVVMLGFARGFPYLAGTHPALAQVPRLDTPRTRVPAGSVAIAAAQTGIYPTDSPGGWRLLGRTDVVLFDPHRWPPSPLAPGGRVRLRAI